MATHVRTFRIPDELWGDVLELAESNEVTATAVVLEGLRIMVSVLPNGYDYE